MYRESLIEKIPDDSDDYSENESCDDEDVDDDYDEDEEDDDEDSKIEIVFTNDAPETTKNLKKRVSFNNNVQIKEFVSRPEEHFIRRKEEIIPEREHSQVCIYCIITLFTTKLCLNLYITSYYAHRATKFV